LNQLADFIEVERNSFCTGIAVLQVVSGDGSYFQSNAILLQRISRFLYIIMIKNYAKIEKKKADSLLNHQ
jgi:hypothetical protein